MAATASASASVATRSFTGPLLLAIARVAPLAAVLDDVPVFLGERRELRHRKQLQHLLRRPAELGTEPGHDDRPVDQDRMAEHGVEQLIVGKGRIVQPQLGVGRSPLPQELADGAPHGRDQLAQLLLGGRRLQVLDDDGIDAGMADQRKCVARGAAGGVVKDRHVHLLGLARRPLQRAEAAPASYQLLLRFTTRTTTSITGTSISTPTTVARAAPDWNPNRLIAAATASSKKLLAPINAEGQATLCASPRRRLS